MIRRPPRSPPFPSPPLSRSLHSTAALFTQRPGQRDEFVPGGKLPLRHRHAGFLNHVQEAGVTMPERQFASWDEFIALARPLRKESGGRVERSGEGRGGKGGRSRGAPDHLKKKKKKEMRRM